MKQNKQHLIIELYGLTLKRYSVFFKKLVLYHQERLYTRHNKHYDYQCEAISQLSNYIERKVLRRKQQAFMNIKFLQLEQNEQVLQMEPKQAIKNKNVTRMNTSIQDSDGSYLFSPNTKRNMHRAKTQFQHSTMTDLTCVKSQGLLQLLSKVKKANSKACHQELNPAKSSYFNLTLGGRPSIRTFHQCSCNCHGNQSSSRKIGKQQKRFKILKKFKQLQEKVQYQNFNDEDIKIYCKNSYTTRNCGNDHYYQMQPTSLKGRSRVVYLTTDDQNERIEQLVTSKSVANINQRFRGCYYA